MEHNQLPELYPGWTTVKKIGTGGFGAVYEIQRDLFGKIEKAALKHISIPKDVDEIDELYSNGYDDAGITIHFEGHLAKIVQEYSLMAQMKGHTNVVYCDDIRYVRHEDGFGWDIYIKMELLTPLMKMNKAGMDVEQQAVKLGMDICNALALCKIKGIVHRDIKPQNILVSDTGDYKLGDFGIAKTVEKTSGNTRGIGTVGYMSPEVFYNRPYGSGVDIYSLGLVMYWILNESRLPFLPLPPETPVAGAAEEARERRLSGEAFPEPKNGSKELKAIVMKACAYDPKARFGSAREMLEALQALKPGAPIYGQTAVLTADNEKTRLMTHEEAGSAAGEATQLMTEDKTALMNETEQKDEDRTQLLSETEQRDEDRTQLLSETEQKDEDRTQLLTESDLPDAEETELMAKNAAPVQVNGSAGKQKNSAPPVRAEQGKPGNGNLPPKKGTKWQVAVALCVVAAIAAVLFFVSRQNGELAMQGQTVSVGSAHMVGLKADGTVVAVGYNEYGQCNVSGWQDIVAVSAGGEHTVGLKADGTVVAVGYNGYGQCDVSDWQDIVAVSAGGDYTVGLKADGTVVAVGFNNDCQCDVSDWQDIVAVSAGIWHTVGLKADGTVVAVGWEHNGECDVSGWQDIVAVSAGVTHTVGLKADGTVVATGYNLFGECDVSGWQDIVAVSAGAEYTVGLKADGTVVAVGKNAFGECDVGNWQDIVAVSAWGYYTVGLKADGTVVEAGMSEYGQWDVSGWTHIKLP